MIIWLCRYLLSRYTEDSVICSLDISKPSVFTRLIHNLCLSISYLKQRLSGMALGYYERFGSLSCYVIAIVLNPRVKKYI